MNEQKIKYSSCKQEQKYLQDQLELQTKRHHVELESMKMTLTKLNNEHIFSLKKNLQGTSKEKVSLQVKLKEIEDTLYEKEEKMTLLLKENENLLDELDRKNEELSERSFSLKSRNM